jgi:hypothetical protein
MPLSPDFSVGISGDRAAVTLNDQTTYGGANPERSDLYVFVNLYKVNYANVRTKIPTAGNDLDPLTDVSWVGNYDIDGHYKWAYVAIPDYSGLTSYSKYDAVFADDKVYRSKVDLNQGESPLDTDFWEEIEDPAELAFNKGEENESLNITSVIYVRVLVAHGQYAYANMVSDMAICTDCDEDATLKKLSDFDTLLTAAIIADVRQEVTDGELISRRIQSSFLS